MVNIYVKLNQKSRSIGNKFCFKGIVEEIRNEDAIKETVENGVDLDVYVNGKWINGKDHFDFSKQEKVDVSDEVELEKKEEIDYADLFSVHWRKRVDEIKLYTDDIEETEKLLEYAKKTEEPGSVIEGIEEYLAELRG